ncbi:MAG TPA: hypothetical protein VN903_25120 [Polyangia bacterium]|nr:hypothetical protein [Polyangia bacterium]
MYHHVEKLEVRVVAIVMGETVVGTRRRLNRALRKVFDGIQRDPVLRALARSSSRLADQRRPASSETLNRHARAATRRMQLRTIEI